MQQTNQQCSGVHTMAVETIRERLEDHWWTFEAFAHLVLEELQIFGQGLLYVVFLIMSFCADRHLQLQKDQMAYHAGMNEIDGLHHEDRDKKNAQYDALLIERFLLMRQIDRIKTTLGKAWAEGDYPVICDEEYHLKNAERCLQDTDYKLSGLEIDLCIHSQTPGYKPYVDEV